MLTIHLNGATLEYLGQSSWELHQTFAFSEGEDVRDVAKQMIGPAGTATLKSVEYEDGDQWPTAVYRGTKKSLEALHAKFNGSNIGKPRILGPKLPELFGKKVGMDVYNAHASEAQEIKDCTYCGEPEGEGDDVLAEWVTGDKADSKEFITKLAHGQCGADAGWKLA